MLRTKEVPGMAKTTRASAHQMGFILQLPLPLCCQNCLHYSRRVSHQALGKAAGDTVLLKQEGLPQTAATNLEEAGVWLQLHSAAQEPITSSTVNHQSLSETPTSIPKHKRHAAACGCPAFYCYNSNWKQQNGENIHKIQPKEEEITCDDNGLCKQELRLTFFFKIQY